MNVFFRGLCPEITTFNLRDLAGMVWSFFYCCWHFSMFIMFSPQINGHNSYFPLIHKVAVKLFTNCCLFTLMFKTKSSIMTTTTIFPLISVPWLDSCHLVVMKWRCLCNAIFHTEATIFEPLLKFFQLFLHRLFYLFIDL